MVLEVLVVLGRFPCGSRGSGVSSVVDSGGLRGSRLKLIGVQWLLSLCHTTFAIGDDDQLGLFFLFCDS